MTTVFIVDDDHAVRDALTLMIQQHGMTVEAFDSAEAFLAYCQPEHSGCAIIDMRMPGMDGLQLQQRLAQRDILLPVIFLTGHGDIPMSVKAIKAGAVDFLTKPVTREQLLASVQSALQLGQQMMVRHEHHQQATSRLKDLTERERSVLALAVVGHPNKEIARHLGISHRTVEIHKAHIMHKTGATNLLDLARLAQEAGLMDGGV
jgi:FixJ family two-component response regulator